MTKFVTPVRSSSTNQSSISSAASAKTAARSEHHPCIRQENTKDRPFNGFRMALSEQARELMRDVSGQVQSYEMHRVRKRARRPEDQQTFERQIEALVSDLAHREITEPGGWLAISFSKTKLGKRGRYGARVLRETLPDVVRSMAAPEMEFVELQIGHRNPFDAKPGKQTVIRAGVRLRTRIAERLLTTADFGLDKTEEIIILKDSKEDHFDKGKWIDYEDTPQTAADREELWRINDHIERAVIEYIPWSATKKPVDATDRRLRRYFNNSSFEQGGRLFGGFWQPMKKRARSGIVIDGMDTVTLDYGQMMPRILYGLAGAVPHFEDAYLVPELESYREGVKKVFNAMVHSYKPLKRKPQDTVPLLPAALSIAEITEMIRKFHEPVSEAFYVAKGLHLTYLESKVLITVLLRLIDQDITALPIHDAVIVAEDNAEQTKQVMLQVFKELIGINGLVRIE